MTVVAAELRFPVMGSHAHLIVVADGRHAAWRAQGLARRSRQRLQQLERRWSRFLPDSEVCRLAAQAGRWVAVSADTATLVQRMVDAHELTDGRFDATVLPCVEALGYDRSFERLPLRVHESRAPAAAPGLGGVQVDAAARAVRLPPGTALDPGGIGKGLAADVVAGELQHRGATGACVNVGGDVRVRGRPPDSGEWRVGVPGRDGAEVVVALQDAAVATSSPVVRRWRTQGGMRHHLVDARRGESADGGLATLSVVAATGWQAEVLATAGAVAGWASAEALLARVGGHAVAWTADGRGLATADLVEAVA